MVSISLKELTIKPRKNKYSLKTKTIIYYMLLDNIFLKRLYYAVQAWWNLLNNINELQCL